MITPRLVLLALAIAVATMIANVAVSIAWVFVYSELIDPGRSNDFYNAYAQRVVPGSSIIAGIPILFAAGWWIARGRVRPVTTALLVPAWYGAIDLAILLTVAANLASSGLIAVSFATKLLAAAAGGALAARMRQRPTG